MVYHSMGDEDVERIMRYPNTAIASDGGVREFGVGMPHPRSYGTNARVLAEYVRKRNVLTLEDAIRRMTSLPARTFGFRDRGLVARGLWRPTWCSSIPAEVQDKATFSQPASVLRRLRLRACERQDRGGRRQADRRPARAHPEAVVQ